VGDPLRLIPTESEKRGILSLAPEVNATRPDEFIEATGLIGVEGLSGSLAGSPRGVVGLYLGHANGGRVLPIWTARRFAGFAEVPWQLSDYEFFDCARHRRVCAESAREVKPLTVSLRDADSNVCRLIPIGKCALVPEGKYLVEAEPADVTCEPMVISVFEGDLPLKLSLQCEPNLMGIWRTKAGDQLSCTQTGLGAAQCGGLTGLGFGVLQANLRTNGREVKLEDGYFHDGAGNAAPASGVFQWQAGRLSGELTRVGYPSRRIELSRTNAP
jgi:hypothetical protein